MGGGKIEAQLPHTFDDSISENERFVLLCSEECFSPQQPAQDDLIIANSGLERLFPRFRGSQKAFICSQVTWF